MMKAVHIALSITRINRFFFRSSNGLLLVQYFDVEAKRRVVIIIEISWINGLAVRNVFRVTQCVEVCAHFHLSTLHCASATLTTTIKVHFITKAVH